MSENGRIIFETVPKEFKYRENLYVMQYEFSGIQSFLFGNVTLSSTDEGIGKRSAFVVNATDKMEQWLKDGFSRFDKFRTLSKSSGKLICAVSHFAGVKKILKVSDELQRMIYASTGGKLEMFYGVCAARVARENDGGSYENAMSILAKEANRNKFHCENLVGALDSRYVHSDFVPELSADRAERVESKSEITAAIKFDLDNLGSFFQKVTAFDKRKAASESLAAVLNGAFRGIDGVKPIFIGGDDIFAVARLENYPQIVSGMYRNIKEAIASSKELSMYLPHFGISGGVSFIRNDLGKVPLVYYYEQSEDELDLAKSVTGKNKVAISNCTLSWEQLHTLSKILDVKKEIVFQDLNEHQVFRMYTNILELKSRLMRMQVNSGRKLLTEEEEQDVNHIN